METACQDQESFPAHLTRSGDTGKYHPRLNETGQQESHHVGSKYKLGHHFIQDQNWNLTLDEGQRPSDQGDGLLVQQLNFSGLESFVTFYRVHMIYFLMLGSLGTLGIYVLPLSDSGRLTFVDAIYTSFSAMCGTGLQTVRSRDLTQFHNFVILVLMILGAPVLVSLLPIFARRFYFHLFIKQFNEDPCKHRGKCASLGARPEHDFDGEVVEQEIKHMVLPPQAFDKQMSKDRGSKPVSMDADCKKVDNTGDHPNHNIHMGDRGENGRILVDAKQALRTLEYRALVALSWVVICFFVGGQVTGFMLGAIYFFVSPADTAIAAGMGINPTFYAFFTAISTFTNGGYNVNNDGMLDFKKSSFLFILYTILASLGNTLYAPFLRLLVWFCYRAAGEKDKAVYDYLLRHPRRCFTNLFPKSQTIWLVVTFVAFTAIQLVFLCILEWNQALGGMTAIEKLIVGVYQAVGTRNAGGNAVSLYQIAPAVLFVFVVMMYISAYPNFLSLQTSNDAYDDAELLVPCTYNKEMNPNQWKSIVVVQSRRLLARDTSYLFFAMLFLLLSENTRIKKDPLNFSIFNIVFEVISAYGSIGLSLGYHCDLRIDQSSPCEKLPYSFSGTWTSTGKLVIVGIMFLGRHRGLPDNIDSAIQLPAKPSPPKPLQTPYVQQSSLPRFSCSNSSFLESLPGSKWILSSRTSILDFYHHGFTLLNLITVFWIKAQQ